MRGEVDEQAAIRRLKSGDSGGLEYLVSRFQVRAIRTAYLILGDGALAEEVVQEAFLHAYRAIGGFDEGRPFQPWFLRSVVNASLRQIRKTRREIPLEDAEAGKAFFALAAQLDSPQAEVEAGEVERELQQAMEKLSPRQRAVIVQRYFLGMSEAEMASQSGAALGTIKWLLNAARQRMRRLLVERSDE